MDGATRPRRVTPRAVHSVPGGGVETRELPVKWVAAVYVGSLIYAVVRYVVFAPKNLENIPVFVANKGVAMAAALCFAMAFVQQWRRRGSGGPDGGRPRMEPAVWFRAGVFGAIWHVPMALAVLGPGYFKEFYGPADGGAAGRMSFAGELVFFFGGLAAAGVYLLTRTTWTPRQRWGLSVAATATLLAHVLAMGYCRGLNINASHAYLPPMWLLSAVGIVVGVVALAAARPEGGAGRPPGEA